MTDRHFELSRFPVGSLFTVKSCRPDRILLIKLDSKTSLVHNAATGKSWLSNAHRIGGVWEHIA